MVSGKRSKCLIENGYILHSFNSHFIIFSHPFFYLHPGPGVCYRIYSDQQYADMDSFSTPEVSRVPLASLLLLMSSLGVNDVRVFPFIDKPPDNAIEDALLELKQHVSFH